MGGEQYPRYETNWDEGSRSTEFELGAGGRRTCYGKLKLSNSLIKWGGKKKSSDWSKGCMKFRRVLYLLCIDTCVTEIKNSCTYHSTRKRLGLPRYWTHACNRFGS